MLLNLTAHIGKKLDGSFPEFVNKPKNYMTLLIISYEAERNFSKLSIVKNKCSSIM